MRILIDKKKLSLSEEGNNFIYKLLPLGRFYDERYGWLEFGKERLEAIAKRFDDKIPAYEIFITEEHWGSEKVANINKCYFTENEGLYIEGTVSNQEIFEKFDYMSAELEPYVDKINGGIPEETLTGCALTNRPANPYVEKIKLSETEEIELINKEKEDKEDKTEEEVPMTKEEKEELDRIKAENERLKAEKVELSEQGKKDKVNILKAKWLSEGVAPATVNKAEQYLLAKEENGKIHLSETKKVDFADAIDDILSSYKKIDLSEIGRGKGNGQEENLEDIAKKI